MSVTVSIRLSEDTIVEIERLGYKPSEFVKSIIEKEVRREKSRRAIEYFRKNMIHDTGKTAAEMIREDRDSR